MVPRAFQWRASLYKECRTQAEDAKVMKRTRNQYAAPVTPEEFVNDFLAHRVEEVWSTHHVFKCLKPKGPGVDKMATGYYRTNYQGRKKTVHTFVLETLQVKTNAAHDCSHLCGSGWCCNPQHLCWESRQNNIDRRGCAGFVTVDEGQWVRVCKHNPPCKRESTGEVCAAPSES